MYHRSSFFCTSFSVHSFFFAFVHPAQVRDSRTQPPLDKLPEVNAILPVIALCCSFTSDPVYFVIFSFLLSFFLSCLSFFLFSFFLLSLACLFFFVELQGEDCAGGLRPGLDQLCYLPGAPWLHQHHRLRAQHVRGHQPRRTKNEEEEEEGEEGEEEEGEEEEEEDIGIKRAIFFLLFTVFTFLVYFSFFFFFFFFCLATLAA
jgi:hypothetical protein